MLPVDEPKRVAFGIPVYRLRNGLTEANELPHFLVSSDEPVIPERVVTLRRGLVQDQVREGKF